MTPPAAGTILRVGLTGNIGAGKSTVAAILAEGGCLIIDADRIGHTLLAPPSEAYSEIVEAFGPSILTETRHIDRAALGRIVFAADAARESLNAILHPRIRRIEDAQVAAWDVGRGIAVTEAALLVETGAAGRYHRLVVVVAPADVRSDRLVARGMDADDAQRRMAAQMDEHLKAAQADYRLDNRANSDSLRRQVESLIGWLHEDLERLESGLSLPIRW